MLMIGSMYEAKAQMFREYEGVCGPSGLQEGAGGKHRIADVFCLNGEVWRICKRTGGYG